MKRVLSFLLVLVLTLGLLAGCKKKIDVPASAILVMETVWGKYTQDEKFPAAGGAGDNMNWEGPAAVDMAANGADLSYIVYVPEAEIANLTDAATMQHAMNANTFTAGVLRVKEGTDAKPLPPL